MAVPGYSGYFLKGLAGGIQAGVNFGMQLYDLRWQKEQRKKLKEKEEKIKEGMTHLGGLIKTFGPDYSDDEIMQLDTVFLSSIAEVQAAYKDSLDCIKAGNKRKLEEDFQWLDLFTSQLDDLDLKDVQGLYDMAEKGFKTEKARNYFTAYKSIREKKLDVVKPKEPTISDYGTGLKYLTNIANISPENWESARKGLESKFGFDYSGITQESLRGVGDEVYNLYDTPEEVMAKVKAPAGLTVIPKRDTKTGKYYASFSKEPAPGERVTSLPLQEDYKQKALDANTLEDKKKVVDSYTKAGYDPSEMPTDQEWIDGKLQELDSHVEMLNEITDENGRLKGDKSFNFMSGDKAETQTGEEWYKDIYEAYMFYLKELKKMGIDVEKYLKIRSPGEVSKVGFLKGMFTGGGVERGYPSIYYTETTPTPTETEIPKLPSL